MASLHKLPLCDHFFPLARLAWLDLLKHGLSPTKLSLAQLEMQQEEQQHTYTDLPFMSTVWNLTTLATEFLTFGASTFISPII